MNEDERKGDQLFSHLEELLERLPAMQERGARLARARAAGEALGIARRLDAARNELADLDARMDAAAEAAERARAEGGSAEDVELAERERLYYAAMRGFKVGPVQNGEKELEEALRARSFESVDDARAACLDEADLDRLAAEVAAYQEDYAATLAACERLESGN